MTEATTTRIDQAFKKAWDEELGDDPSMDPIRNAFVAGARAFSTMPLCKHGVAVWADEECAGCDGGDDPGEFPGYNRPFQAALPEGMTEGQIQDLMAEHETLRRTLLSVLAKMGLAEPSAVPWDTFTLLQLSGLYLTDALPFTGASANLIEQLTGRVAGLDRHAAAVGARLRALESPQITADESEKP